MKRLQHQQGQIKLQQNHKIIHNTKDNNKLINNLYKIKHPVTKNISKLIHMLS
jgi:hypothetical protein